MRKIWSLRYIFIIKFMNEYSWYFFDTFGVYLKIEGDIIIIYLNLDFHDLILHDSEFHDFEYHRDLENHDDLGDYENWRIIINIEIENSFKIKNSLIIDNKKDSIILENQLIWRLIYSNQDISKIIEWLLIDVIRKIFSWEILIIW